MLCSLTPLLLRVVHYLTVELLVWLFSLLMPLSCQVHSYRQCIVQEFYRSCICVVDWSGECSAEQLRRVRDLAIDFSLFLSPQQLASQQHTSQLLQHSLATVFPPSTGHCIPCKALRLELRPVCVHCMYMRMCVRLGRLLGYSEHEVRCQIVGLWLQQAAPSALDQ